MTATATTARQGDGRLWAVALMLSLSLNVAILALAGFASLKSEKYRNSQPVSPAPSSETTVMIFPDTAATEPSPETPPARPAKAAFSRTSEDQAAPPSEKPAFIGERDTQATSDRAPSPSAPALPSQSGIEPKNRENLETTESRYQDGSLASNQTSKPQQESQPAIPTPPALAADPTLADTTTPGEMQETPGTDDIKSAPPPREALMEGPNPVDVPIPPDAPPKSEIKPTPPKTPKQGKPAPTPAEPLRPTPQAAPKDPSFSGFQRKTAIQGSISRTGRSALNVADTPLGRYQAIISRAVELEWQRNCVRHRDFITPGFLTVRFFVEPGGRVRTVQFVGDMETGEVQKGFTLNSIRDAKIPAMPQALRKEYADDPLELIFNFYF
ncbi:MAG: hypothetical protein WEB53_10350 [Akkermansiaceae bacterium]